MSLTSSPAAARPRRRSVLTGALGATGAALALPLAAGCTDEGSRAGSDGERSDAAQRLRSRAARDSEELLARYDGTVRVHHALAARLRPLRDEVARHVRVLRGSESGTGSPSLAPTGPAGSRSPSASPDATRSRQPGGQPSPGPSERPPSPDTGSVPEDEKGALAALAAAERRLAAARTKALGGAPPELARLLASIAACGSAHGYLLDSHGKAAGKRDGDDDDGTDGAGEDGGEASGG
ncbi:hypothetical protein SALCHL_004929 [Streptomyces albus subsp. chlorinus]|uniref:hypothetical protein n=1 Tax=Streptomyces albus TaxID=1888 RepID=UPI003D146A1D